jgi:hypothetical protein
LRSLRYRIAVGVQFSNFVAKLLQVWQYAGFMAHQQNVNLIRLYGLKMSSMAIVRFLLHAYHYGFGTVDSNVSIVIVLYALQSQGAYRFFGTAFGHTSNQYF